MPTYTFRNVVTGQCETSIMTLKQREEFLAKNPNIVQVLTTPAFGDSVRLGVTKTPDSFNDLLKNMKKHHRHSTMETKN